jgi:hypothetical protein
MEPAPESTEEAASLAVSAVPDPADGKLDSVEKVREELINRFRKSVEERVKHQDRFSTRPITIVPSPADGQLRTRVQRRLRRATRPDSVVCVAARRDTTYPTDCRPEGRTCVT